MPPTENPTSAEALKSVADSLFKNIEGGGLADPPKFFQDATILYQAGILEVGEGVQKQPTPILLLLQDVVNTSGSRLAPAFIERVQAKAISPIAFEADLQLGLLLGVSPATIDLLRERYTVPEPPKPAERLPAAVDLVTIGSEAQPAVPIPPQEELIRLAQTGNLNDFTRAFFLVWQDKKEGINRGGPMLGNFLARDDVSDADRDTAQKLFSDLFLPKKPVDATGGPGLVASAVERRAGSQEATLFGRGSPFKNERRLSEPGQSPITYSAEYQAGELPVHLGQWLREDDMNDESLMQNFPPAFGQWVQEPRSGPVRIIQGFVPTAEKWKERRVDENNLNVTRAVLMLGNSLFKDDDSARPPRIYGYGMAEQSLRPYLPYLVTESPDPNFMKLDQYLWERGGRLPENEAVEIAMKLCKALVKFHQFRVEHHGFFDSINLKHLSWNTHTKQLRIEGWGAEDTFQHKNWGDVGSSDIYHIGELLFQLATGKKWSQTDDEIYQTLKAKYPAGEREFYAERAQLRDLSMATLNPAIVKVLQRSLWIDRPMEYRFDLPGESKRMLIELFAAHQELGGRQLDGQAAGSLAEAEKRLIYRNVAKAYKAQQSSLHNLPQVLIKYPNHPVPQDRIKEVAEDIEKRKKSEHPMTIDQIIDMMAQSYNFNLDKAIELAGINQI